MKEVTSENLWKPIKLHLRNKAELSDCFLQANLALSTSTSSCSVHFVKTIANLSTVMLLLLQIQEVVVIAEPGAILYTSTKKKKKPLILTVKLFDSLHKKWGHNICLPAKISVVR